MKTLYPRASNRCARGVRAQIQTLEPRCLLHAGHGGTFINAGGTAAVDGGGHAWQADAFFTGGQTKPAGYDVAGTSDDAIYASRRFGATFGYAIPVSAAGTYRVSLLFAEPWFTATGQRIFNVSAENAVKLSNIDLIAAGAVKSAISRSFDVSVNDGTVNLQFVSSVDAAMVSGISVEKAAQVPPAPGALSATPVSATQINLKWTDSSAAETGFAIERSADGVSFTQIAVVGTNATAYNNTGLTAGVNYTYRVKATSAAGASAASNTASARTPGGSSQTPFGNVAIRLPATIEAENFDNGGAGVAFSDITPVNAGGMYRETPVDIYPITTTSSLGNAPYAIGSIRAGEWVEYSIDVPSTGSYTLQLRFASGSTGGTGQVLIDNAAWSGAMSFGNTGGWSTFALVSVPAKSISAGRHVVRVQFDQARTAGQEIGVLDWIRFSNTGGQPVGPIAPTRFAARGVGDTQVNLSWDDVSTNEQSFTIQRKRATDASFATVATLPPNTEYYIDANVLPSTSYVYRVIAQGPGGAGLSNEIPLGTWNADSFRWKTAAANPLARYEAIGAAANGKLFVFGGYINNRIQATARVDAYDPAANTWKQLGDMPEIVTHAGQAVDGRYIFIAGGFLGDHPGLGTNSVWRYDTTGDRWDRMPSLPAARGAGALSRVGTELHYFGGLTRAQFVTVNQAEHWVLDLTNPLIGWKTRAALPNARNHLAATELNGKIYAIGGQDVWNEQTGAKSNVDVFDPITNTWTAAAPLPIPRSHTSASTFSLNGKIYVIGGATNNLATLRDVTVYNPAANAWSTFRELTAPRLTPVAGAIGKMLIVSTGSAYGLAPQGETWFGLLD